MRQIRGTCLGIPTFVSQNFLCWPFWQKKNQELRRLLETSKDSPYDAFRLCGTKILIITQYKTLFLWKSEKQNLTVKILWIFSMQPRLWQKNHWTQPLNISQFHFRWNAFFVILYFKTHSRTNLLLSNLPSNYFNWVITGPWVLIKTIFDFKEFPLTIRSSLNRVVFRFELVFKTIRFQIIRRCIASSSWSGKNENDWVDKSDWLLLHSELISAWNESLHSHGLICYFLCLLNCLRNVLLP